MGVEVEVEASDCEAIIILNSHLLTAAFLDMFFLLVDTKMDIAMRATCVRQLSSQSAEGLLPWPT